LQYFVPFFVVYTYIIHGIGILSTLKRGVYPCRMAFFKSVGFLQQKPLRLGS